MLSSKFIIDQLPQYGEKVLECPVYISRSIHDPQNQRVLHSACALLNTGGGLLHMHNVEHAGKVQSKDLDTWWSGMESNLADILSGDDLCNYFDFIGNFDDRDLFLFVKTAEHLCTLNYHCRLPTDTATHNVTYASAAKLLSRTGDPSPLSDLPTVPTEYQYGQTEDTLKQEGKQIQFKLLATNRDQAKSFADRIRHYCIKYISAFANHYGGHVYFGIEDATAAVLGEALEASMEHKITRQVEHMMQDMIWGDMNVHAVRGKHWDIHFYPVTNCPRMERRRVVVVSVCKFPGGVFTSCPDSYVVRRDGNVEQLAFSEWKAEILNQSRVRPDLQTRFVKVALRTPFSRLVYTLPHTLHTAKERVLKLSTGSNLQPKHYLNTLTDPHLRSCISSVVSTFADEPHLVLPLQCWGTRLSAPHHDDLLTTLLILSQHYGMHLALFVSSHLNSTELWTLARGLAVELKRWLVQHGGCVDRLPVKTHLLSVADPLIVQNFLVSIDSSIYPPTYLLSAHKMDNILTALVVAIASYRPFQQGLSLSPTSRATSGKHNCYFLLTCDQLELLWTRQFTKELWVHGPPGAGKTVAAMEMIRELVARGCKTSQVLYLAENPLLCAYVSSFKLCQVASRRELMEDSTTPQRFIAKYKEVRNVIIDEAQNFKDRDGDWYSLAEKLANQGAESIVLSNPSTLSDYTSTSQDLAIEMPPNPGKNWETLTDKDAGKKSLTSKGLGSEASGKVSHNQGSDDCNKFLTQDLTSAPKKPRPSRVDLDRGYFWVFMDYAQKVHKFKAGLPSLIGKNNFMLSEISRNSKEIFDYALKFMDKPSGAIRQGKECVADTPVLGHGYQNGKGVEVMKCAKDSIHQTLFKVLESYLGDGIEPGDIAILVSKRGEKEAVEKSVKQDFSQKGASALGSDSSSQAAEGVTVDTVRRFSGLDKPVIIGLEPHTDDKHADLDKFIVNLATRAKDGLVIITTSDELMRKLQIQ